MMLKKIHFLLVLMLTSTFALAQQMDPDDLIEKTASEVIEIIKKDKDIQAGNKQKIKDLIEGKVLPHFDFTRMTRLAVGRFWNQATPEQQKALTEEFRSLLVRTYSTSLTSYKDHKIEYKPVKLSPGDTDVVVKTMVIQPVGRPLPIDYSMIKTPSGWKAYDITVEGISLVVNYRSSFTREIQEGGFDQLIKTLHAKNISSVTDTKKN